MPALALESPRHRSVLKLSLGISLAVFVVLVAIVLLSGANAEAATYNVTTSAGTSNWTAPTLPWTCTAGAPGSTGCGLYPGDPTAPGAAAGDIANVNGVGGGLIVNSNIANAVTVNINNSSTVTVISGGALTLTGGSTVATSSGTLTVNGGTLTNNGVLTVNPAGTLNLSSGTLVNNMVNGIVVQGATPSPPAGTFNWSGGSLHGAGSTQINSNAINGALNVSGTSVSLDSGQTISQAGSMALSVTTLSTDAIGSPAINNSGTTTVSGPGTTVDVQFNNSGTVSLPSAGSTLVLAAGGTHTGTFSEVASNGIGFDGSHTFNPATNMSGAAGTVHLASTGTAMFNTGVTIGGTLLNDGSIGFGPGATTQGVSANSFAQSASGKLNMKLNGTIAGSSYDQLRVTGAVSLAGTLNVPPPGYSPVVDGTIWTIITSTSESGDFGSKILPTYANGVIVENPPTAAAITLQAVPQADIALTKTGTPSILDGQNATYTVKVTNGGPSVSTVTVTDTFSGPASFVSVTPVANCIGTGPVTCTFPSMAVSTTQTISLVLKGTAPGTINNTATASSSVQDPNPANDSASFATTVNPAADLSVTAVSGTPNPVDAAQPATWQVGINNAGPDAAASVIVNMSIATGTINSVTPPAGFSCSNTASTAQCTNPSFAAASSVTIILNATAPNQAGVWTMNANVGSSTADPGPGVNSNSGSVNVNAVSDMKVFKTLSGALVAGANANYTIDVKNFGPSDATGVVVDDTPGAGLTFVSVSGGGCVSFPCTIGSMTAGAVITLTATYAVAPGATGSISNTATVTSSTKDPNPGNNSSTTTNPVTTGADLSVTKTGPSSALPGSNVTFTIVVTNNGPSDALAVQLNDPTPPRLSFLSASGACASFPCSLGTMKAGATTNVQATYTVLPGPTVTVTNTATASSTTPDPKSGNNSGSASFTTGCPEAPVPSQPANGATDQLTHGILVWSDAGAASYNVFLGPVGSGCTAQTPFASTTGIAVLYNNLQPGTTYEWRVESVSPGCSIKSSACLTFTISNNCPTIPPTLTAPLGGTVIGPATFSWSAVPGARDYQLFVNGQLLATTNATTFKASVGSGMITWYVVAEFDPPCGSLRSQSGSFNSCDPSSTTIPSIVGQADSGQAYVLSWDALSGATKYEVDEATDQDFTNVSTKSTTATQLTFQHPVNVPTAFYYRVRAFIGCANAFGPNSVAVRVVLSPVTVPFNPNVSAPFGNNTLVPIVVHVPGLPGSSFPFTATVDPQEPWMVRVTPSSGALPPEGIDLTVLANPSGLSAGTHTGTVLVAVTTSAGGPIVNNGVVPISAPVSVSLVTPIKPQTPGPPTASSLIIPTSGHLDGINSHWATDIRIHNTASQRVKYQLTFTPDDATKGIKQTLIDIDAGTTTALDDIIKTWYGIGSLNESSNGSLEIRPLDNPGKGAPSNDDVSVSLTTIASSRVYNSVATATGGTLGEFVNAIPFVNFVGRAVDSSHAATILGLQQIAQSDSMRTNVGVMESSGQPVSAMISVFDPTGTKLLDYPLTLFGGQHAQLNSFLAQNKISLPDGRIEVKVTGGEGKITAYASVIDNKSGAPIFISGVPLGEKAFDHFVLPGVADLNTPNAAWRTDARFYNPTPTVQTATVTFYPLSGGGSPKTTSMTINPGEVKRLDNTLQSVFGLTNTGGAIHVTTTTAVPLVISGRTYDLTPNGTYGQLTSAVTAADAIGKGDRPLQILQAEDSVRARTNLGVFEVTGKPATVEVMVFLPDSKVTASTQIPLAANGVIQVPIIQSLGLSNIYNARISLRVVDGDGRISGYGSVIDQVTQAPMLIPPQR